MKRSIYDIIRPYFLQPSRGIKYKKKIHRMRATLRAANILAIRRCDRPERRTDRRLYTNTHTHTCAQRTHIDREVRGKQIPVCAYLGRFCISSENGDEHTARHNKMCRDEMKCNWNLGLNYECCWPFACALTWSSTVRNLLRS